MFVFRELFSYSRRAGVRGGGGGVVVTAKETGGAGEREKFLGGEVEGMGGTGGEVSPGRADRGLRVRRRRVDQL